MQRIWCNVKCALPQRTMLHKDHHSLALDVGQSIAPAPQEITFASTLRFEDLFAVVDLYRTREVGDRRRRVIEASWTCSVTPRDKNEQGEQVASNTYFTIMEAGEFTDVKKMVIIR